MAGVNEQAFSLNRARELNGYAPVSIETAREWFTPITPSKPPRLRRVLLWIKGRVP